MKKSKQNVATFPCAFKTALPVEETKLFDSKGNVFGIRIIWDDQTVTRMGVWPTARMIDQIPPSANQKT